MIFSSIPSIKLKLMHSFIYSVKCSWMLAKNKQTTLLWDVSRLENWELRIDDTSQWQSLTLSSFRRNCLLIESKREKKFILIWHGWLGMGVLTSDAFWQFRPYRDDKRRKDLMVHLNSSLFRKSGRNWNSSSSRNQKRN